MIETFVARYRSGDRIAVWRELHAIEDVSVLGSDARQDVDAVVRETVDRAVCNLITIYNYLDFTNFDFDAPSCPMPASSDAAPIVAMLRERLGPLPPVLTHWLDAVTILFWRGRPSTESERWESSLIDPFEFAVTVESVAVALDDWSDRGRATQPFDLEFAGDSFHKNEVSGGVPTVIRLPSTAVDARVYEDVALSSWAETGMWFVDYLRLYFEGGGFRLTGVSDRKKVTGLLPLPVAGLIPI